jgi:hypothetical protein
MDAAALHTIIVALASEGAFVLGAQLGHRDRTRSVQANGLGAHLTAVHARLAAEPRRRRGAIGGFATLCPGGCDGRVVIVLNGTGRVGVRRRRCRPASVDRRKLTALRDQPAAPSATDFRAFVEVIVIASSKTRDSENDRDAKRFHVVSLAYPDTAHPPGVI